MLKPESGTDRVFFIYPARLSKKAISKME